MTWLRDHIREWVVPGLRVLSKHYRKDVAQTPAGSFWSTPVRLTPNYIDPTVSDVSICDVRLRSAKGACETAEASLVYSAVSSYFSKKHQPVLRQQMLDILLDGKLSGLMSEHRLGNAAVKGYQPQDVAHSAIKSSWRSLKQIADGRTIILPGRDVWPWEILARKEDYPTVYDPRISRAFCFEQSIWTDQRIRKALLREVVAGWDVSLGQCLMFDTGWLGSIPAAIRKATGVTFEYKMLSAEESSHHNQVMKGWTQIFPHHKNSRGKVLCIEYFPKYCKTGTVRDGRPVQYLNSPLEFVKAAALTIWMWHHQSPRFVRHRPKEEKGENHAILQTPFMIS